MAVTTAAQLGIAGPAARIMLSGDAGPMEERVLQSLIAGMASEHDALLAAAPGHRGDPRQDAQAMVISPPQKVPTFGEQRGQVDPADSREGAKDRHVALLALLPRRGLTWRFELGAELVQLAMRFLDLLIDHAKPDNERADVSAGRLRGSRRNPQRLLAQDLQCLGGRASPNAVRLEKPLDRALAHLGGLPRGPPLAPQVQETIGGKIVAQLERLRIITPELLSHPVAEAIALLLQVVEQA